MEISKELKKIIDSNFYTDYLVYKNEVNRISSKLSLCKDDLMKKIQKYGRVKIKEHNLENTIRSKMLLIDRDREYVLNFVADLNFDILVDFYEEHNLNTDSILGKRDSFVNVSKILCYSNLENYYN